MLQGELHERRREKGGRVERLRRVEAVARDGVVRVQGELSRRGRDEVAEGDGARDVERGGRGGVVRVDGLFRQLSVS